MQYILFNTSGLLRSGWRAAIFLLAFVFTAMVLGTLGQMALEVLGIEAQPWTGSYLIINALLSLAPALVIGWLCAKYLENLPFRSLGVSLTRGWLRHFWLGVVVGAVTLGLAVLIPIVFGGLNFEFNGESAASEIAGSLAITLAVFAAAAAFEEVLFRGYVLQTFSRAGLAWLAILLTSLFFGAVHMGNPNSNLISSLNTVLAGVWFGVAYLKTRDLWFVWGLHLMWNWTQGAIFGIEVSGITSVTAAPLLKEIDSGPAWLTGGSYGLEGGIACTAALAASIMIIHFLPGLRPDEEMLRLTSPADNRSQAA